MGRRVGALGLDLGWASPTGWALVEWQLGGEDTVVARGEIVPTPPSGRVTVQTQIARAESLYDGLSAVVVPSAREIAERTDDFVVCYESVDWLLAAARQGIGKSGRKPVTVDSLMASIYPVAVLWLALRGLLGMRVEAVRTRTARATFGVDGLTQGRRKAVDALARNKRYGSVKKAAVGVAVGQRVGWVPESSHVADALLLALVELDRIKMFSDGSQ